jgi:hypothetical protein
MQRQCNLKRSGGASAAAAANQPRRSATAAFTFKMFPDRHTDRQTDIRTSCKQKPPSSDGQQQQPKPSSWVNVVGREEGQMAEGRETGREFFKALDDIEILQILLFCYSAAPPSRHAVYRNENALVA